MWDSVKLPENEKFKYLTSPEQTSLHNYGLAVDLSIVDENNVELDMGSQFDTFNEISFPSLENMMLNKGKLNISQIENRTLLRNVMNEAGFSGITTEWWHFNSTSRANAKKNYKLILFDKLNKTDKNTNISTFYSGKNTYKIQLMSSARKVDLNCSLFKGLSIEEYFHNGQYKYTHGNFYNAINASSELEKIRKKEFKDAFIVIFRNNIRIN